VTPVALPTLLRRRLEVNVLRTKVHVGIALSGGIDSCSVLAACLRRGMRPTLISYTPSTHESTDYQYAKNNAALLGLPFYGAKVDMRPARLEYLARYLTSMGYRTKMQVESLAPMVSIAQMAQAAGVAVLYTGDQADGYYINGNWISRNYDRAQGIPGPERTHVREDPDAERIDKLRDLYWDQDRGNCAAVEQVCAAFGVRAVMPYRDPKMRELFRGYHWREVNEPRLKEPVWQAYPELRAEGVGGIWVRPAPVNLHRGDSRFAEMMGKTMLELFPAYKTPLGVYGAMARGEL
jgi:asparagine synthetase B (glutamine-hydrolysing)